MYFMLSGVKIPVAMLEVSISDAAFDVSYACCADATGSSIASSPSFTGRT
ncbi:hypothetical protein GE061_004114, partial [Apolygus lucorum]